MYNYQNNKEGFNDYQEYKYIEKNPLLYQNDTIYEQSIKESFSETPEMICNIIPTSSAEDCIDSDAKSTFKLKKFPVHILPMMDKTYLAVFNDGMIYQKSTLKSKFWKGPLLNSLPNDSIPLRMITIDSENRLLGVGYDNNLYEKQKPETDIEKERPLETKWVQIPNSGDIIYILYDQFVDVDTNNLNIEEDKLVGINTQGMLVSKNFEKRATDNFEVFQDSKPVFKICYDKNGYIIGIGNDFKLYRKSEKFLNSQFDVVTSNNNKSKLNDVFYDIDGKLYGLVFQPNFSTLELMKQVVPYYLSEFAPLEMSNTSDSTKLITMKYDDVVKRKTGVNVSIIKNLQNMQSDLSLEETQKNIYNNDIASLRQYCGSLNKNKYENYELLNRIEEQEGKIEKLREFVKGLTTTDKSKKLQEDIM